MTHQRGGRPGSSGRGATGGGASDVGSRNWEIAHGIDVGGKSSGFAHGAGNKTGGGGEDDIQPHRKKDVLIHAAGDEYGYDLHGRLKGKSVYQLKKVIEKIYLEIAAGPRGVMENILNHLLSG